MGEKFDKDPQEVVETPKNVDVTPVIPDDVTDPGRGATGGGTEPAPAATDVQPGATVVVPDDKKPAETESTGTVTETETPKSYLYDWKSGISLRDAAKLNQHTLAEIISDQQKWAHDNGVTPDYVSQWAMLHDKDADKTLEQNEVDEKKRLRQEKWQKLGNFLSHLGNFVGTTMGAPSQTLENPVELTKRQQTLRDKTLAQRSAYNNTLFEMMAKQRAADRQAELDKRTAKYQSEQLRLQQKNADIRQQQADRMEAQMWLNDTFRNRQLDIKEAELEVNRAYKEGLLSQGAARVAIMRLRENRLGAGGSGGGKGGSTKNMDKVVTKDTDTTDPGKKHEVVKTEYVPRGNAQGKKKAFR